MPTRLLSSLLVLVLCASAAFSQQPVPEPASMQGSPQVDSIRLWLASPDPRLNAWAAYFILAGRHAELLGELETTAVKLLESRQPADYRRAVAAILDTLIQLEGTLPASSLAQLDTLDAAQAILLNRLPWTEAGPVFLENDTPRLQFRRYRAERIADEMLARHPAPAFAARLVGDIVLHARVVVRDPGPLGGIGWGFGSCCGAGAGPPPKLWPTIGVYSLLEPERPGAPPPSEAKLLLAGIDPIYMKRTLSQEYFADYGGCHTGLRIVNDAIRTHLLATTLGLGTPPLPDHTAVLEIQFKDRESYFIQVQAFVEGLQNQFAAVTASLARAGLLTEVQRQQLAVPIQIFLQDQRTLPRVDLPPIAFRSPVAWVKQDTAW